VDRHIVAALREADYDTRFICEDCPGVADTVVLELAEQDDRVLLTEDKDFGELVFRVAQASHGVMLIRLSELPPREAAALVLEVVETHRDELIGRFAVLNSRALRLRELG
jgi:predicted nuclease of predicted toxin-antitoxin system